MTVYVNEKPYEVEPGATLESLMLSIGVGRQGVAVAIGNSVVPRNKWPQTPLEDGTKLMLIHAVSGG